MRVPDRGRARLRPGRFAAEWSLDRWPTEAGEVALQREEQGANGRYEQHADDDHDEPTATLHPDGMVAKPAERCFGAVHAQGQGDERYAQPDGVQRQQHSTPGDCLRCRCGVRIVANTGPMHGAQPNAKAIPTNTAERGPRDTRAISKRRSRDRNPTGNTPRLTRPRTMIPTPDTRVKASTLRSTQRCSIVVEVVGMSPALSLV